MRVDEDLPAPITRILVISKIGNLFAAASKI
jgi:hypothetical protein